MLPSFFAFPPLWLESIPGGLAKMWRGSFPAWAKQSGSRFQYALESLKERGCAWAVIVMEARCHGDSCIRQGDVEEREKEGKG